MKNKGLKFALLFVISLCTVACECNRTNLHVFNPTTRRWEIHTLNHHDIDSGVLNTNPDDAYYALEKNKLDELKELWGLKKRPSPPPTT